MMSSLYCVVTPSTPYTIEMDLLPSMCAQFPTDCAGIVANSTTARYGAFSVCSHYQSFSWALNNLYLNELAVRNTTACSVDSYARLQTPSVLSPACRTMLAQAGPLADQTIPVASVATETPTSSGTDSTTSTALPRDLIAGIVLGSLAGLFLVITSIFCLCKRRARKHPSKEPSSEGLEVGEAPPGFGHVRNVELGGESKKKELWTNRNTTELATESPNVEMSASATPGKAYAVGDEIEPMEEGIGREEIQEAANNDIKGEDKTFRFSSAYGVFELVGQCMV